MLVSFGILSIIFIYKMLTITFNRNYVIDSFEIDGMSFSILVIQREVLDNQEVVLPEVIHNSMIKEITGIILIYHFL